MIETLKVACPICGSKISSLEAKGPDYDCHCCEDQIFKLVKCAACEVLYLNPRPTREMLGKIYPETYYAGEFDQQANPIVLTARNLRNKSKAKKLLALSHSKNKSKVLDVGAGDGSLLDAFVALGCLPENMYALELDKSKSKSLKTKLFNNIFDNVETVKLKPENFDLIVMLQVIEHLANPMGTIRKMQKWLKDGGLILFETPNTQSWDRLFFKKELWGGYHFPRHWTLWNKDNVKKILEGSGFKVVQIQTLPSPVLWAWSLNHVWQKYNLPGQKIFSINSPFVLALFWLLETFPSLMGKTGNMQVVARKTG